MRIPVLTAIPGASWEADLVAQLSRADHGVTVIRRCADVAELLSTAASGTARAALISTDLRRLDRDTIGRLASAGVAAVGLVRPGDSAAEHQLRRLGVHRIVAVDAGAAEVARAVVQAVAEALVPDDVSTGDPAAALPVPQPPLRPPPPPPGRGRIVAVWGPAGAPGRTTVSIGLADETARLGVSTLLVDADVYGGTVAQTLGLLDESAGLVVACHAAARGRFDVADLAGLSHRLRPTLRVLTGAVRADRWPELRPTAMLAVLEQARHLAAATFVDCGFCLEQDEELAYDTAAPRRNGATLAVLRAADTVVCVGSADPVGLRRLVRGLDELRQVAPGVEPLVVVNRVRATVVPGEPRREIDAALHRWAGVAASAYLPAAPAVVDTAMRTGATLAEAAPDSPLRRSVADLARTLAGVPAPADRRRRLLPTHRRGRRPGRRAGLLPGRR
jgi:MinD-like ATPase involved in chromosome partitioning or flagellar assembly